MVAAQHACLMRSADRDRRASVQGCSCRDLRSCLCGGRRRVGGHREKPGILFSTLFLQSRRPVQTYALGNVIPINHGTSRQRFARQDPRNWRIDAERFLNTCIEILELRELNEVHFCCVWESSANLRSELFHDGGVFEKVENDAAQQGGTRFAAGDDDCSRCFDDFLPGHPSFVVVSEDVAGREHQQGVRQVCM